MASVTSFVNLKGAVLNHGFLNNLWTQFQQSVPFCIVGYVIDNNMNHSGTEQPVQILNFGDLMLMNSNQRGF